MVFSLTLGLYNNTTEDCWVNGDSHFFSFGLPFFSGMWQEYDSDGSNVLGRWVLALDI